MTNATTDLGPHFSVRQTGDTHFVLPTDALIDAKTTPAGCLVGLVAFMFGPLLIGAIVSTNGGPWVLGAGLGAGLFVWCSVAGDAHARRRRNTPLIVCPNGLIEYEGTAVRGAAAVESIRVYREDCTDDPDSFEVEVRAADGSVVTLPYPIFRDIASPSTALALGQWLAHVFDCRLTDETLAA